MIEHDEVPQDVAYLELSFDGVVVRRVPITPEQARRWLRGERAIGIGGGEPLVDEDGRLIEQHEQLPMDPTDPDAFDHKDDEP